MPSSKIKCISRRFQLVLLPLHCLILQTLMSSVVWLAELRCSATGSPGVRLRMLRRCSLKRSLRRSRNRSRSSSLITSAISIQLSSSHLPSVNLNCLSSTLIWQSPTTEYRCPYTTRRLTHTTICTTLHSTHIITNKQYRTASFYVSDGYVLMMSTFLKKLRRC